MYVIKQLLTVMSYNLCKIKKAELLYMSNSISAVGVVFCLVVSFIISDIKKIKNWAKTIVSYDVTHFAYIHNNDINTLKKRSSH